MSNFTVKMVAATDPTKCSINASGNVIHQITDAEATAFGFNDRARIQAACGAIIGKNPDEWFLHAPTTPHPNPSDKRYDNAYSVFGWTPVTVTLEPLSAVFLGIDATPVIASYVVWKNDLDHPANYSAGMAVSKSETVGTEVTQGGSFTSTSTIDVSVGIEGIGDIGSEQSFAFESNWSDTTTRSQTIEVGVNASASSDVPAHTEETAYLFSTLGSARYRVTYRAALSGRLMTINNDWYKDHGYRGLSPYTVLQQAGLPTDIVIHYEYTLSFYSGADIIVAPGPYDPNYSPTNLKLAQTRVQLGQATRVD
ncbi:MAG: hypothetical protein KBH14_09875 [Vicinamibacteria bacterium]|nr:hypothetical protein [Vicinamibacteria bacterium]